MSLELKAEKEKVEQLEMKFESQKILFTENQIKEKKKEMIRANYHTHAGNGRLNTFTGGVFLLNTSINALYLALYDDNKTDRSLL